MPNRRDFLLGSSTLALAAGPLGLFANAAQAQSPPATASDTPLLTRRLPKSERSLPLVGLGTFLTFDLLPGANRDHLREVVRRYWAAGGRVIDTSPLYGMGEVNVGAFIASLDIGDELFVTNKIWSTGEHLWDESHARRSLDTSCERLWRSRIDVMQCHSLVNVDAIVPMLQAWKREGRIGHVGISHHENTYMPILTDWVSRGAVDFVHMNYSIFNRQAEQHLLPAAQRTGTAVLVNMPFEKARLFKIVEGRPLPDLAREIGATSWAQYFLKWVISHPAVTCALPATSNPDHVSDNMGALRGPLPDAALRERMAQQMRTIPGFDALAQMPWYPGKRYPGVINRAQTGIRARAAA
ncbi:MAG: aldo/keto reductase [Luteimonas sp.]